MKANNDTTVQRRVEPVTPIGTKKHASKAQREEAFGAVFEDGSRIESIYDAAKIPPLSFISSEIEKAELSCKSSFEKDGVRFHPPERNLKSLRRGSIILPSNAEEYGSSMELLKRVESYIHKYLDLNPFDLAILGNYAFMTWHWDDFSAVPYLRFQGQPGTGKTRCLQVMKAICYRSIDLGVSPSSSALLRSIDAVRGTSFIDEADYEGDFRSDLIKMLNAGYKKDGIRTLSVTKAENWQPEPFSVGGPKILANRHGFNDRALETRCITIETVSKIVSPRIPTEYPPEFRSEGESIRNQMLMSRLRKGQACDLSDAALWTLDGRTKELALPIHNISPDPNFRKEFLLYMEGRSEAQREDDPSRIVLEALVSLTRRLLGRPIELKTISWEAIRIGKSRDVPEYVFTIKKTGDLIRGLRFEMVKRSSGKVVLPNPALMKEQSARFHVAYDAGDASDEFPEDGDDDGQLWSIAG